MITPVFRKKRFALKYGAAAIAISSSLSPTAFAQADNLGLEEILVTAQKRTQNLRDVPISLTSVGAETFANTNATSLGDLSSLVANFSLETVGEYDTVFIRGVGGGGRSIGFSSRAGVYLDGVFIGQTGSLDQTLLDIERVEVLRGPQGHLFGRNTVSGAVSMVTKRPDEELAGNVRLLYGNYDAFEVAGTINVPLTDTLFAKVSAQHRQRDGFTRNILNGDDYDNVDAQAARAQFRALATEKLTLDVTADYSLSDERRLVGENISNTFGDGPSSAPTPFEVDFNVEPFQRRENFGASLTAEYVLDSGIVLTSLTAWRKSEYLIQNDIDYSPADFFFLNYPDTFEQFTQELRAVSPQDQRARWIAGVFYLKENADTDRDVFFGADNVLLPLEFTPNGITTIDASVDTNSIAFFAALDFDITDRLVFNGGIRYTRDKQDLLFSTNGDDTGIVGIVTVTGFTDDRVDDGFTPTVGFTYKVTDTINVFAKYSRGFKGGGFNVDYLDAAQFADGLGFEEETVNSYEIGIKGDIFDRRVRFDAAIFRSDFDDYQLNQFVEIPGGVTVIQLTNAADVRSQGAELNITAVPTDWWQLSTAVGYVDADFQDFPNGGGPGINLGGEQLPFAPETTVTVASDMNFDITAGLNLQLYTDVTYRSSQFSEEDNRPDTFIESRTLLNGRVTISDEDSRWSVSIFARNILDEDFIERRFTDFFGTLAVTRGQPRTFGAEARLNF